MAFRGFRGKKAFVTKNKALMKERFLNREKHEKTGKTLF
jgi:hypothetical protein